jgi:hypothetical protein
LTVSDVAMETGIVVAIDTGYTPPAGVGIGVGNVCAAAVGIEMI